MLAIMNALNAHNLPIFQPILMILVSKFMVHRALSDKTYLLLGLLSPLRYLIWILEENTANSVYLCVLRAHFSPVKFSETIFRPRIPLPDPI